MQLVKTIKSHLFISIILCIALILRIIPAMHQLVWFDEAFTINSAIFKQFPFYDAADAPLYFALIRLMSFFSIEKFWLRIPSIVFSIINIALCYSLAKKYIHIHIAKFVAFGLAISAYHIHFAWQIRMYSLYMLLSTAALYQTLLVINQINKNKTLQKKDLFILFCINLLGSITHYTYSIYTGLLLCSLILELIIKKRTHELYPQYSFGKFIASHGIYLPIYYLLLHRYNTAIYPLIMSWVPKVTIQSFLTLWISFSDISHFAINQFNASFIPYLQGISILLLFISGIIVLSKLNVSLSRITVIVSVGSIVVATLIQKITSLSILLPRTFCFLYPIFMIVLATMVFNSLRTIGKYSMKLLVLIFIGINYIPLLLNTQNEINFSPVNMQQGFPSVIQKIIQMRIHRDDILVMPLYYADAAWYYWNSHTISSNKTFPLNEEYMVHVDKYRKGTKDYKIPMRMKYILIKPDAYFGVTEARLLQYFYEQCNREIVNEAAILLKCPKI